MDLPIENGGSFHSYVNVYRRVTNFHQPFTHLSFTVPTDFGQLFMKGYATGTIPNLQLSSLFIVEQPIHPHQCLVLYAQCHFVRSILLNLLIKFSFFSLVLSDFPGRKKSASDCKHPQIYGCISRFCFVYIYGCLKIGYPMPSIGSVTICFLLKLPFGEVNPPFSDAAKHQID